MAGGGDETRRMFLRGTHPGEDQHKTTYSYYVEPYIRLPTATPIVRPRAVACLALDTHALAIRANNRHGQEGRQERVYPLHLVPEEEEEEEFIRIQWIL